MTQKSLCFQHPTLARLWETLTGQFFIALCVIGSTESVRLQTQSFFQDSVVVHGCCVFRHQLRPVGVNGLEQKIAIVRRRFGTRQPTAGGSSGWLHFINLDMISMGTGKTMVLLLSA